MHERLHRVYVRVMGGLNGRCARSEMAVLAMANPGRFGGGLSRSTLKAFGADVQCNLRQPALIRAEGMLQHVDEAVRRLAS